jgi:hypothetical protein
MDWEIPLFGKQLFSDYESEIKSAIRSEIERQPEDYLLNVDEKEYIEYLFGIFSRPTPIINEDKIRVNKEKGNGKNYCVIEVPFEGNQMLFECRPTESRMNYYTISIQEGMIKIRLPFSDNPDNMKRETDAKLGTLKHNLQNLDKDLKKFNSGLRGFIKEIFNARKQKLMKENNLLLSVGFPLKEREDASKTYVIPEIKKRVLIEKPEATPKPNSPDPIISERDYENILSIIDNMAQVMERSPSAFIDMKEEDLRVHFLVQLNSQYEGEAMGEVFNLGGKTDILIRHKGNNLFIAECKFWTGKEGFKATIDQLLDYVSWRDTKTAIILFNKNKDSSKVLEQIPGIIKEHSNYAKTENEGSLRFMMKNKNDEGKTFTLTIKLFDIPKLK